MTVSMAVGAGAEPIGASRRRARRRARRRVPVALAVPMVDGAVLAAATTAAGPERATLLFSVAAWLLLTLLAPVRHRLAPRLADHAGALVASVSMPVILVGPLFAHDEAGVALLAALPFVVVGVAAGRVVSYAAVRAARARRAEPTLLVGAGAAGTRLAGVLGEHREFGLAPVGFVDDPSGDELPLPWLGDLGRLEDVIRRHRARRVIVTAGAASEASVLEALRTCLRRDVEFYVAPSLWRLGARWGGPEFDDLWGIPVVRVPRAARRAPSWRAKRVMDVVGAGIVLVLAAPALAAIALAVKASSRGPVLFRQTRLGVGGQPIQLLKFRSMTVNGDSDTTWSVQTDARVTKVGRLLRATSLDELPQLFNVIRGDISLVGPRPERPFFAAQFNATVPGYEQRLRVPAGMTGWAQIHGLRGDTSIAERAEFDNSYIESWSLRRDLLILVRTLAPVLRDAVGALSRSRRRSAGAEAVPHLDPEGTVATEEAAPAAAVAVPVEIDLRDPVDIDLREGADIDLRDGVGAEVPEPVVAAAAFAESSGGRGTEAAFADAVPALAPWKPAVQLPAAPDPGGMVLHLLGDGDAAGPSSATNGNGNGNGHAPNGVSGQATNGTNGTNGHVPPRYAPPLPGDGACHAD